MITIDETAGTVTIQDSDGTRTLPMASAEAFEAASRAWLRCGWDVKHVYSFTWLGRPIIQLPEDMMRVQEVLNGLRPDVIIETGVAHGGSLVFYASLCKLWGKGRVIGIDVEIRPHNRAAIEAHDLFPYISLIEGSSIDPRTVEQVGSQIRPGETVFVMLDSNHSRAHVLEELKAYGPMVTPNSYMVASDGIMEQVKGAPRTAPDWNWNNPKAAAEEFVRLDPRFQLEQPPWLFNEGLVREPVTYWPGAYLKRTG